MARSLDGEPISGLVGIKAVLDARVSLAEADMQQHGALYAGVLDHALQERQRLDGSEGEVDQKLMDLYQRISPSVDPQLFPLIEAYLLDKGLIAEKRTFPQMVPEGASVEEIVQIFRGWLADSEHGDARSRRAWQVFVEENGE
jgi:hypothetical protein